MKKIVTKRTGLSRKLLLLLLFAAASVGGVSAATGSMSIGGAKVDLGTNGSGSGWAWNAASSTLTLSGNISGNIDIANTAGDVTVTVTSVATLSGQLRLGTGNLTISGGGKLTVDYYSSNVAHKGAIDVRAGGLEISGIAVDVTNRGEMVNHQAIWTSGDFRMASGSLVTTSARGVGVLSNNGSIYISGTASLTNLKTADNIKYGYGPGNGLLRAPGGSIEISGGTVTGGVTGGTTMGALVGIINITGGTVNVTRGGIWGGDVTVGGATAVVRIEGDILATGPTGTAPAYTGSLTVSGGTVTVNGRLDNTTPTVAGMITVTGGDVTIDGVEIEPGVVHDENNLMAALRSTSPSTIKLGQDITLSTELVEMGADHTINVPLGYTLGVKNPGRISVNGHSLSLEGSGTVNLDGEIFGGTVNSGSSTLNITGVSMYLRYSWCINVITVNVNGGTVNFVDATKEQMIFLRDNTASLNINGGTVDVQNFKGSGIENVGGTVHVNGGTLILRPVGDGWAINNDAGGTLKYTSGTLTGVDGAIIQLTQGTSVEGMAGKLNDRGTVLTSASATVGSPVDAPSATGLSNGKYAWNGSAFVKTGIIISTQPQDVEFTVGEITGNLTTAATASNSQTVNYQWHRIDLTLLPPNFPEVEIPGATGSSFTIPTNLAMGTYQYVCKMTAPDCDDVWTRLVTVTVKPATTPVTITAQPQDMTVVEGSIEGSLTVEAESEASITYQWYLAAPDSGESEEGTDNTPIEGATEAEFVLPTDLSPGTYTYYVVVSAEGAEPVTSDVAVVTVAPAPAVPLFMGLADQYTVGAPAVPLRTMGIGASALSTFKVNGVAATEFDPETAGVYQIEATSADGKLKIWKYVTVK